ncbi:hypothetical protein HPB47_018166 [Ixodes persulcatus]|uniref:Uncharacterized protein n=1 Tax=Ixodes persulcatus TaxID=34615 RepID=A0AC60QLG6_IXOPE|nr:hypothetical protein HPB47_018166 [Ixodes persulcatus]
MRPTPNWGSPAEPRKQLHGSKQTKGRTLKAMLTFQEETSPFQISTANASMTGTEGKSDMPQFEYWTNRWNNGDTPWQRDGVYPLLEKNQDVIFAGKQDAQVYVPMCGKAPDLKWFYDKGHRVVGVEFIEAVARSFFVDNCLPLDETECHVLKCKILQVSATLEIATAAPRLGSETKLWSFGTLGTFSDSRCDAVRHPKLFGVPE